MDSASVWVIVTIFIAAAVVSFILLPRRLSGLPVHVRRRLGWGGLACLVAVGAGVAFVLVRTLTQWEQMNIRLACSSSLRNLASLTRIYAADWDDSLPEAEHWMDNLKVYATEDIRFQCPSAKQFGYAFNSILNRAKLTKIERTDQVPLLYDSSNLAKNANDPFTSLPGPARHGRNNVAYADGRVRTLDPIPSP